MQGYKCDRCGEFTESEPTIDSTIGFGYRETAALGKGMKYSVEYDLCGKCRTELVKWVKND